MNENFCIPTDQMKFFFSSEVIKRLEKLYSTKESDIPYWTSPPLQFVYESTAALALGRYTFADNPSALTPTRPLLENALYFFRSISFSADASELDYTQNVISTATAVAPLFYVYKESDSNAVLYREPFSCNKFYDQFDFRFWWQTGKVNDQLLAGFTGAIMQGAAFVGKASMTLKVIISAQEIVDDAFIEAFKDNYLQDFLASQAAGGMY